MRSLFSCLALIVVPSIAQSSTIEVDGTQYSLETPSCTTGEGYYLIDAKGDGVSLSVSSDKSYTAFDFFYVRDGEDLRAGATMEPIPLQNGAFLFEGEVPVSNGKTTQMSIQLDACP